MSLRIGRKSTTKLRVITTLIALFAFVVQPYAGIAFESLAHAAPVAPGSTVVTPSNHGTWSDVESQTGGAVSFVADSSALSGNGALKLTTDATSNAKAHYQNYFTTPVALSAVGNTMSYSTKQNSAAFTAGDPSYQITVNVFGTSGYNNFTYEPYVDQGNAAVTNGIWQDWNVGAGKFYSSHSYDSTQTTNHTTIVKGQGQNTYTLAEIRAAFPNASVTGVGINVGSYNPSYDVEADKLVFNGVTYDFEPTPGRVKNTHTLKTFDTIQAAINDSDTQNGDTITAAAGDYSTENVNVTKSVTLEGAQSGAAGSETRGSESEVKSFTVSASNVTIDGFSLTQHVGNQINVAPSPAAGLALSGLVFENNVLENYTSVGLTTNNAGNVQVKNNLFANVDSANGGQESIQIRSNGTPGSCSGSTVSNNIFNKASVDGADANFSCDVSGPSNNVTVSNNTSTNTKGSFTAFSGVSDGITVKDNNVSGVDGSTAIFFFGAMNGVASITGNSINGGNSSAVGVSGAGYDSSGPSTGTFTITNNDFSNNNATGISFGTGSLSGSGNLSAHQNNLSGNTNGVKNSTPTLVDATKNFWGGTNGPTDGDATDGSQPASNPTGTGSAAVGAVSYGPWCTVADCSATNEVAPGIPTNPVWLDHAGHTLGAYTKVNQVTPKWTAPTAGAVDHYEYSYQSPTAGWSAPESVGTATSIPDQSFYGSGNNGTEGVWQFRIHTVNQYGTASAWATSPTITYDKTKPVVSAFSIGNPPPYSKQIKASAVATDTNLKNVVFYISNTEDRSGTPVCTGNGAYLAQALGTFNSVTGRYEATIDTSALTGTYCVSAVAEDFATNHSVPEGRKMVQIDNTAPTVVITEPTANQALKGHPVTIKGTASDDNFNYYYCYVTVAGHGEVGTRDAKCQTAWAAGTPFRTAFADSATGTTNGTLGSVDLTGLADGNYTVHVVAKDKAGNTTEATQDFVLDTTAPVLTTNAPTRNPDGTYTITGTSDDHQADVKVSLDGSYAGTTTPDSNGDWSYTTTTAPSTGEHTFSASSTDAAGNTRNPEEQAFTVASTPVGGSGTSRSGGSPTSGSTNSGPFIQTTTSLPTFAFGGNGSAFGTTAPGTTDTNGTVLGTQDTSGNSSGKVLGTKTTDKNADGAIAPSSQGWKILGFAWYWWLLALVALGLIWYLLFGRKRRNSTET